MSMHAAVPISAWTTVACAAGILASRRYGAGARLRCWSVLAFGALILSAFIAVRSFCPSVGVSYWIATLSVSGAAVVAGVAARPALAAPIVWIGTVTGMVSSGVLAWTMR